MQKRPKLGQNHSRKALNRSGPGVDKVQQREILQMIDGDGGESAEVSPVTMTPVDGWREGIEKAQLPSKCPHTNLDTNSQVLIRRGKLSLRLFDTPCCVRLIRLIYSLSTGRRSKRRSGGRATLSYGQEGVQDHGEDKGSHFFGRGSVTMHPGVL